MKKADYDVIILGGGLAGLSLSIQLKREKPDISILVIEKQANLCTNSRTQSWRKHRRTCKLLFSECFGIERLFGRT